MALLEELRSQKSEIEALASKYGVSNIRVFGSVARGEERPDSDIDLVVDGSKTPRPSDVCAFAYDIQKLLKRHVDILTDEALEDVQLHPFFKQRILDERKVL